MKEKHYNAQGRPECFLEMETIFGRQALISFCELNAYKYAYRADLKNQKQSDLDKQIFYDLLAKKLRNNNHKPLCEILKEVRGE